MILVGQATRDEAKDGLRNQVQRHLESASVELAAVVDMKLSSAGGALVGVLVDVLRQSVGACGGGADGSMVRARASITEHHAPLPHVPPACRVGRCATGKPANSPLHDTTDYTADNIPSGELSYIERRGAGSAHGSLKYSVTMLATGKTRTTAVNTRTRESAHLNAFFPLLWNEAPDVVSLCVHAPGTVAPWHACVCVLIGGPRQPLMRRRWALSSPATRVATQQVRWVRGRRSVSAIPRAALHRRRGVVQPTVRVSPCSRVPGHLFVHAVLTACDSVAV